ncbi:hypothetical protein [Rhizobium laguerreae]|uniref:hypothetical protein n=1 Tax=Rhizobium laguerreae TaxID=1076926 RepID=UPI001038B7C1|nr:hypothetical protein [Rhizobium laguerreae]TBY04241.1 hypothetical protein E0I94_26175 [Rhizobium laguerreae]
MGLFDLFRRKPAITPERMLEYGVFLRDLNNHCDALGIDRAQHILLKTSQFLMFGGDLARTISGRESVTPETDHMECAASLNLLTQGIHQMMMEKNGEETRNTPRYKQEWTQLFEFTLAHFFGWDVSNPNVRGVAIMDLGSRLSRKLNTHNPALQQRSCNAWGALLRGQTDESVEALAAIYVETLQWARAHQPLQ